MSEMTRRTVILLIGLAGMVAAPRAQEPRGAGPEDHLPSNITRLTAFGERASWSPDGQRIAFMSKSFGDAFVADVATKIQPNVQAALTGDPNINYVIALYDSAEAPFFRLVPRA